MAGKKEGTINVIFFTQLFYQLFYSLYLCFLSRLPFWLHLLEWKRVSEWSTVGFIEKLHWPRERLPNF